MTNKWQNKFLIISVLYKHRWLMKIIFLPVCLGMSAIFVLKSTEEAITTFHVFCLPFLNLSKPFALHASGKKQCVWLKVLCTPGEPCVNNLIRFWHTGIIFNNESLKAKWILVNIPRGIFTNISLFVCRCHTSINNYVHSSHGLIHHMVKTASVFCMF